MSYKRTLIYRHHKLLLRYVRYFMYLARLLQPKPL